VRLPAFTVGLALATLFALACSSEEPARVQPAAQLDLWYYHHSYIVDDDAVAKSKALIDKAAAAGYTGAVFWDTSFDFMGNDTWPIDNEDRMKEVMKYARKKHLKAVALTGSVGWSNDLLAINPNWAEASRIIGAQFTVDATGRKLKLNNSFPGIANNSFESGKSNWDAGDRDVEVMSNGRSGSHAATVTDARANSRLRQRITLKPWRQYHLSLWVKSTGFQGGPMVEVIDSGNEKLRFNASFGANGTNDWHQLDYLFNSQDTTSADLYLGVWGGSKGVISFDDVVLEETAFVYIEHSAGAPFKLYDPANPAKVYREGSDYNPVLDPDMHAPTKPAFHNVFHWPPSMTLPAGTQLTPGQIVAADFYAVFPMTANTQTAVCLTEPAVYKWLGQNARAVKKALPPESAILFSYDELRQANSCFACRSKNLTAGQLVAWSIGKTIQIYQNAIPSAQLFVWNDMFDPYHNAHDGYYYVEGDLAGSWKGVPAEVSIMNWNLDHLTESLTWFSGRDPRQPTAHRQIIAGYYDKGPGAPEAAKELKQAAGIPGITGIMYTTYADDYSQLGSFAEGARAAWRDYLSSVAAH
jgi:hypothetical protein